ncbi:MAG: hypothetical protein AAF431_17375 [Pseudomonadota bacterium]
MPNLETLIASTLYLMTRQSKSSKACLEQSIVDHLQMLGSHPDCDSQVLKDAAARLSMCWHQEARAKQLGIDALQKDTVVRKPAQPH